MKKSLLLGMLFATVMIVSCDSIGDSKEENNSDASILASDSISPKLLTNIEFADTVHQFGEFNEGEKVTHEFKYKNTGENPLILEDVKASCGCTIPEWEKGPIEPGKEGVIKVVYNSEGRPGEFHKTITVIANTAAEVALLKIEGTVIPKKVEIQGPYKK